MSQLASDVTSYMCCGTFCLTILIVVWGYVTGRIKD